MDSVSALAVLGIFLFGILVGFVGLLIFIAFDKSVVRIKEDDVVIKKGVLEQIERELKKKQPGGRNEDDDDA